MLIQIIHSFYYQGYKWLSIFFKSNLEFSSTLNLCETPPMYGPLLTKYNLPVASCRLLGHFFVSSLQEFEHPLDLLVLMAWELLQVTDAQVNQSQTAPIYVSQRESKMALTVSIGRHGLRVVHGLEQVIPGGAKWNGALELESHLVQW